MRRHGARKPIGWGQTMIDNLTWDNIPDKFINFDNDAAKCFSCRGWFPIENCVINHDEEHQGVPVCETCAEGRVRC